MHHGWGAKLMKLRFILTMRHVTQQVAKGFVTCFTRHNNPQFIQGLGRSIAASRGSGYNRPTALAWVVKPVDTRDLKSLAHP